MLCASGALSSKPAKAGRGQAATHRRETTATVTAHRINLPPRLSGSSALTELSPVKPIVVAPAIPGLETSRLRNPKNDDSRRRPASCREAYHTQSPIRRKLLVPLEDTLIGR